jgi:hypothetical protein
MAITANVQINGSTSDVIDDTQLPGAMVEVQLCGYGSQVPRVPGTFAYMNLTTQVSAADDTGQYHFAIFSNDLIVPQGTYYTFTYKNPNGDVAQVNAYRFIGAGIFDTSELVPYDPNQPPPPLPPLITNLLLILAAADNMIFDGSASTAFKTTLTANVTQPVFENMASGNLYTFIIVQDGTGGHNFVWPSNVRNATPVDPAANSTTIQTFVADDLGDLYAISAGTYYP